MTALELRARDMRRLIRYFAGETDRHPHGLSGAWLDMISGRLSSRIPQGDFDGFYGEMILWH